MPSRASSLKTRILVVDDHILLRIGLVTALNKQPDLEVVAETEYGKEAVAAYRSHRPDVVILDLRLPDQSGLEVLTLLKGEFPEARVLVLTSYGGVHDISTAMQAGASGYVLKSMPLPRLLDSLRRVASGEIVCLPEIARSLAERSASHLTDRELEVLGVMARGFSNKEIASHLNLADGTVKLHVSSILLKLGVADRTQAVLAAVKRGLVQLD